MKLKILDILDKRINLIVLQYTVAEVIWICVFGFIFFLDILEKHTAALIIIFIVGIFPLAKRDYFGGKMPDEVE